MTEKKNQIAISAAEAPVRTKPSNYPEPFASRMLGREKRPLGDLLGLTNFGINLTRLAPNAVLSPSSRSHQARRVRLHLRGSPNAAHRRRSYPTLSGHVRGLQGSGTGHHLINETSADVVYLEVGDRTPGDEESYPDDDLKALLQDGKWKFVHKDGGPY